MSNQPSEDSTDVVAAEQRTELEGLVRFLDSSIRVPFTERRFGWDAVLGLVPGLGDASGLAFSGVVIARAVGLGARGWTLVHMLVRALVDALVGTIPVVGTAFDFVYKANERNLRLLDEHLADPGSARRSSRSAVLVTVVAVVTVVAAVALLLVAGTVWLLGRLL